MRKILLNEFLQRKWHRQCFPKHDLDHSGEETTCLQLSKPHAGHWGSTQLWTKHHIGSPQFGFDEYHRSDLEKMWQQLRRNNLTQGMCMVCKDMMSHVLSFLWISACVSNHTQHTCNTCAKSWSHFQLPSTYFFLWAWNMRHKHFFNFWQKLAQAIWPFAHCIIKHFIIHINS
jgi:hypothetical protein